ncbi:nucleotide exchange factor GrpE [Actinomadura sp. DC4]|uniref:nucleotide exchange factor GrpE n=1 Tax=Actinomadura sp. DC4 TaxID=3055069 RepID=UPI0025B19A18|nr:nucleotide exchange factor GrpE [Actinomadura sp. DC4]MDN3353868.1 nucleotide exchange factor GrpE [Actinomadura sp. DC4]
MPDDEPKPVEAVAAPPDEENETPAEEAAEAPDPFAEVGERLGRVEAEVAEFHRRSAHREAVIDRLHEENQRLRGGLDKAVLQPVVADLIRLYDQLDREARRLGADAPGGPLFRSFADDVALILDRCGIEVFTADPGDPFQHDRHRPLAVVPCDDESRHNTVAEVIAAGFAERDTGRIRRPLQARFHQFEQHSEAP